MHFSWLDVPWNRGGVFPERLEFQFKWLELQFEWLEFELLRLVSDFKRLEL
jgi:hypothetical protein